MHHFAFIFIFLYPASLNQTKQSFTYPSLVGYADLWGPCFGIIFFDAPGIRDHTEKTGFKWDCFFCQPKILLMAPLQQRIRNAWDNYIFKSKINWVTFTSKRLFAGAKSVKLRRWEADDWWCLWRWVKTATQPTMANALFIVPPSEARAFTPRAFAVSTLVCCETIHTSIRRLHPRAPKHAFLQTDQWLASRRRVRTDFWRTTCNPRRRKNSFEFPYTIYIARRASTMFAVFCVSRI